MHMHAWAACSWDRMRNLSRRPTTLPSLPTLPPCLPCGARSFRHVLGIESDPELVLAAKELKEKGRLEYAARRPDGAEVQLTAVVPDDIDRDRVR
jgi:hypothetical protein